MKRTILINSFHQYFLYDTHCSSHEKSVSVYNHMKNSTTLIWEEKSCQLFLSPITTHDWKLSLQWTLCSRTYITRSTLYGYIILICFKYVASGFWNIQVQITAHVTSSDDPHARHKFKCRRQKAKFIRILISKTCCINVFYFCRVEKMQYVQCNIPCFRKESIFIITLSHDYSRYLEDDAAVTKIVDIFR